MLRGTRTEAVSTAGSWSTELVKLGGQRIVESTIPGVLSGDVLRQLAERSARFPAIETSVPLELTQAVFVLPSCGARLASNLLAEGAWADLGYDPIELLNISLADFARAIRLPIASSYRADTAKVSSQFRTNAYRQKASVLRRETVLVDEVEGLAAYVPPSANHIDRLLTDLYQRVNLVREGDHRVTLVIALLLTCQWLAVHPLTDGNGRTGRALFIRLCKRGGIQPSYAALLLSVWHAKYRGVFHTSLMAYCLAGDFSGLEALLPLCIVEVNRCISAYGSGAFRRVINGDIEAGALRVFGDDIALDAFGALARQIY